MHKIKPFFNGSKNEDVTEYHKRARFMRESCKVFGDLYKSDKDFLNKSVDNEITKTLKDLPTNDLTFSSSILSTTINDLLSIHDYIDTRRRDWLDKFRTLCEQAKEKQSSIRQTMSEARENYERTVRKFETAEANFKKFQNRSDPSSIPNYEERARELEETRNDCRQARSIAHDIYTTETYRIASEEHFITRHFYAQYLFDQQDFYKEIEEFLSYQIPKIQRRLDDDKFAPIFHCDLAEHCLKRIHRPIAYPIETCIRLLQNSLQEEGIFRIGSTQVKQKKLTAELDLQLIDSTTKLQDLGYDAYVPANTLKQYLRELPNCLLTEELLPQWNEIPLLTTEEARIQRISQLINQLPQVNYDNLCYLIRFLSRVAENSSENKMTANNLGICIVCSLLYPKEQSANTFTKSSIIIELMIIHHKQFFHNDNQSDLRTSYRATPDLIPTASPSKKSMGSKENLVDIETPQPSARPSAKHRPAPPPPSASRPLFFQLEPTNIGETSTEPIEGPDSSNSIEKRRRSGSGILDRLQNRPRLSTSIKEQENSLSKEENEFLFIPSTSNDDIHPAKSISDSLSSNRNDLPNSPGEITQF